MGHIAASKKYNDDVCKIWDSLFKSAISQQEVADVKLLPPALCVPQATPDVCVVGMNPSHSTRYLGGRNAAELSAMVELDSRTTDRLIETEIEAQQKHPYFLAIRRFLSTIDGNLKTCFCDLYPIRHTSQVQVTRFLDSPTSKDLTTQLNQAITNLFLETDSKMVVICNAEASRRFRKLMDAHLVRKSCKASDVLKNLHGAIPVLYSSMLSGQRAMDEFSRERLKNDILRMKETENA